MAHVASHKGESSGSPLRIRAPYLPCMPSLFDADSLAAWRDHLNRSTLFREAAAGWRGTLLLLEGDPAAPERTAWVEVADGSCAAARGGDDGDAERADFVLAATPATWDDLVSARTTPVMAAITGRLRLVKGDLLALAPHAKAAAALLAAANGEQRTENGEQRTEQ
jgi:putative sterol carrier protein